MDEVIGSRIVNIAMIARSSTTMSKPNQLPQDTARQRFFLAQLYTLIATMCESGGDFMENRFRKDVWPITAKFLGSILEREERRERKSKSLIMVVNEDREPSTRTKLSDSECHLIIAIFECIGRVVEALPCPESIMTAICSILLPFLETSYYGERIGAVTMTTLKRLSQMNSDVIFTQLLNLTGTNFRPLRLLGVSKGRLTVPKPSKHSFTLQIKAQELLSYVKALPEQTIE